VNPFHARVSERAGHRCEYCRAPEIIFNSNFEVDHIVPVALGGTNDLRNLSLACAACNLYKSNSTTGIDPLTDSVAPLFNPRMDLWSEHFTTDSVNATLEGLTPVGRATVARLQMNHPVQVEARLLWMQLGLFP
jgi:hypothetical protein